MNDTPIVMEQEFPVGTEVLWRAITDRQEMVQWFFEPIAAFRAEVGFETNFVVDTGERSFDHRWRVLEVIAGERLVVDWRYGGYPGKSTVTWELTGDTVSSHLRLTHVGVTSFPQDVPELRRESGVMGWTYFIQESLKAYLSGR